LQYIPDGWQPLLRQFQPLELRHPFMEELHRKQTDRAGQSQDTGIFYDFACHLQVRETAHPSWSPSCLEVCRWPSACCCLGAGSNRRDNNLVGCTNSASFRPLDRCNDGLVCVPLRSPLLPSCRSTPPQKPSGQAASRGSIGLPQHDDAAQCKDAFQARIHTALAAPNWLRVAF